MLPRSRARLPPLQQIRTTTAVSWQAFKVCNDGSLAVQGCGSRGVTGAAASELLGARHRPRHCNRGQPYHRPLEHSMVILPCSIFRMTHHSRVAGPCLSIPNPHPAASQHDASVCCY